MTQDKSPFTQFQDFLRDMFQFDHNELDFGLFKVLRLKRTYIEQFISGDGEQDLRRIVSRELQVIRSADDADERQWLANRCELLGLKARKAWESMIANVQDAKQQDPGTPGPLAASPTTQHRPPGGPALQLSAQLL